MTDPARPPADAVSDSFERDVLAGLAQTPKSIPPQYFYDAIGARLFVEICALDEYYPTRTEIGILTKNAAEIATEIGSRAMLIEYGSGSLDKVRILLDALDAPVALTAIDLSAEQLFAAAAEVNAAYPALEVLPLVADFSKPVTLPVPKAAPDCRTAFFPGSTIGNFKPRDAEAFMQGVAATVGPGGLLLIGFDLQKDPARLIAAYDDARGVTAAFNLNLLSRINAELEGDFDPALFKHVARYDQAEGRIEMHLESLTQQTVHVRGRAFRFDVGETLHTENSYKYSIDGFTGLAGAAGFTPVRTWTDAAADFAVMLLRRGA